MANVLAALETGVTELDASVGGLGGSPFAPGGGNGNLHRGPGAMLTDMGIETGIDVEKMAAAARLAQELVGHDIPGHIHANGPRWSPRNPAKPTDI